MRVAFQLKTDTQNHRFVIGRLFKPTTNWDCKSVQHTRLRVVLVGVQLELILSLHHRFVIEWLLEPTTNGDYKTDRRFESAGKFGVSRQCEVELIESARNVADRQAVTAHGISIVQGGQVMKLGHHAVAADPSVVTSLPSKPAANAHINEENCVVIENTDARQCGGAWLGQVGYVTEYGIPNSVDIKLNEGLCEPGAVRNPAQCCERQDVR